MSRQQRTVGYIDWSMPLGEPASQTTRGKAVRLVPWGILQELLNVSSSMKGCGATGVRGLPDREHVESKKHSRKRGR